MGARETALNALIACRKDGAWSNGILKEYMVRDRLDGRDAALAARLCYGVLQNRNKLDFYLKQLLTGKLKDLHPVVHDILHLGLYQIYEMDKIPESAAVNESVDLAKKYCKKQRFAPGLVNGVLRNAVKTKVDSLVEKQLIYTEPTTIKLKDGRTRNGNLLYTIRPLDAAKQHYIEQQAKENEKKKALQEWLEKLERMNTGEANPVEPV